MKILLFGMAREAAGTSSIDLEHTGVTTVKELKEKLLSEYPVFQQLPPMGVAINANYAREGDLVNESDEVVMIPPVSGG